MPTLQNDGEGHMTGDDTRESPVEPAEPETLRMRGRSMHGNREIPSLFAVEDAADRSGAKRWERKRCQERKRGA